MEAFSIMLICQTQPKFKHFDMKHFLAKMSKWMDVFYHVDMPDTRSDSDMAETGNMNGCYSLLVIVLNILQI